MIGEIFPSPGPVEEPAPRIYKFRFIKGAGVELQLIEDYNALHLVESYKHSSNDDAENGLPDSGNNKEPAQDKESPEIEPHIIRGDE